MKTSFQFSITCHTDGKIALNIIKDLRNNISTTDCSIKYDVNCHTVRKLRSRFKDKTIEEVKYHYDNIKENIIRTELKNLNVLNNKHIPDLYLKNSRKIRMAVLAGIIDTDGSFESGGYSITLANERLFDDMIQLIRSLGFLAYKHPVTKICTNAKGGPKACKAFRTF